MSFPKYTSYKDSGVAWIGKVPNHWGIGQSRRLFGLRKERAFESDKQLTASQKYGVIYQDDFMELEGQRVVQVLKGADILKHMEPNDFVISMRSFQGGIEWCNSRGCISSAYVVLIPCDRIHGGFFSYLLKSHTYIQALQSTSNLVRDGQALRYDNFTQVDLPLVPFEEQRAIAGFLDRETAKIDALVTEQRRLIELLKEKRQAVISHAVTKGLNPHAPMKPSGIEWLGDVPEHWGVSRLKYATSRIVDCPHDTPTYCEDGPYRVIRTADLNEGKLYPLGMNRIAENDYFNRIRREPLLRGDIVYSREGGRWGHAALVTESDCFCLGQRMMQFRSNELFTPEYLMWQINTKNVYTQGELDTVGAASPHVNVGTICNYRIAKPPLTEQKEIAKFISVKTDECGLIAEAQRAIDLLQERRTSLISAAVTGKIDVRGLAESEAA